MAGSRVTRRADRRCVNVRYTAAALVIAGLAVGLMAGPRAGRAQALGVNLIANPSAESASGSNPANWTKGGSGSNTRRFDWVSGNAQAGTRSLKVTVTNYRSGDAEWYFTPVRTAASTAYQFSDYYRSDITNYLVAVMRHTNGTTTYTNLKTLAASPTSWTEAVVQFTTPADISTVTVQHLIRGNGWLQTDNFFLGTSGPPPAPNFKITATGGLIDPDGQPYLPRGLDVTGANSYLWDTGVDAHGKSDYFKNTWNLNAIRLIYCEKCVNHSPGSFNYGNLDDLISEYTAKKMVVVVHNQEGWPCQMPDAALQSWTKTFFTNLAKKYKSNPYVWFETYNEPGYDNQVAEWTALQESVIQAIRATGSKNMVIANDTTCGQGRNASSVNGPFNPADSGALVHGQEFMKKYSPIAFDVHIYDRWAYATTDADMKAYFDTAHSRGLPIYVGEVGAYFVNNPSFGSGTNGRIAAERLYRLRPAGVGIFPWIGPFDTNAGGSSNDVSELHWTWTHQPPSPTP